MTIICAHQFAQSSSKKAEDLKKQAAALVVASGAKQTAKSIVAKLLYQLDVASNVYIAYTVMSLFFPTPVPLWGMHSTMPPAIYPCLLIHV